jgi:hypothetical protein
VKTLFSILSGALVVLLAIFGVYHFIVHVQSFVPASSEWAGLMKVGITVLFIFWFGALTVFLTGVIAVSTGVFVEALVESAGDWLKTFLPSRRIKVGMKFLDTTRYSEGKVVQVVRIDKLKATIQKVNGSISDWDYQQAYNLHYFRRMLDCGKIKKVK